jgi:hypothetical protein
MGLDELLAVWLHCFQENRDYAAYCGAKQVSDDLVCKQMESKFVHVNRLYEDWGDIRSYSTVVDSESFMSFVEHKGGLFYDFTPVQWVVTLDKYEYQAGHLLLDIPLHSLKTDTIAGIKTMIDSVYKHRLKNKPVPNDNLKKMLMPLSGIKYTLNEEFGSTTSEGKLKKAIYIGKMDGNTSLADTILAIKQDDKNPFGWGITRSDTLALADGTFAQSYTACSEGSIVSQFRAHYAALVRNTIHGRFPDYSA